MAQLSSINLNNLMKSMLSFAFICICQGYLKMQFQEATQFFANTKRLIEKVKEARVA